MVGRYDELRQADLQVIDGLKGELADIQEQNQTLRSRLSVSLVVERIASLPLILHGDVKESNREQHHPEDTSQIQALQEKVGSIPLLESLIRS